MVKTGRLETEEELIFRFKGRQASGGSFRDALSWPPQERVARRGLRPETPA